MKTSSVLYHLVTAVMLLFPLHLMAQGGNQPVKQLKVLQFNIWQEGTEVKGGYDAIIDEIVRSDADLIVLSEVRNYWFRNLHTRLVNSLKEKGYQYYGEKSEDTGLLSRYPIIEQTSLYPVSFNHGSITKAKIKVDGHTVAFYSAHLDWKNCSLYLPRGYNSSNWRQLDAPVVNIEDILKDNKKSKRDEAIQAFITDANKERSKGNLVILGGDFNEPSHLDWVSTTRNLYDHQGLVIQWPTTLSLEAAGFQDAYREQYPDPVSHPGFTFPSDNPAVKVSKLAWAPKADERDRIDFIFYDPSQNLSLKDIVIIGPSSSILRNQRVEEVSDDPFVAPVNIWPTDHKALLATFAMPEDITAEKP